MAKSRQMIAIAAEPWQRLDLPRRIMAVEHGQLMSMSTRSGCAKAALTTLSASATASVPAYPER
jgi:hypothetical protein